MSRTEGFSSAVVLPGEIPNEENVKTRQSFKKRPPLVIRKQPISVKLPASSISNKPAWMHRPSITSIPCLENFEYLAISDGLLIEQDITCGNEVSRFFIKNTLGEKIYYTKETFCKNLGRETEELFGPGSITHVYDQYDKEVMKFFRPSKDFACCWCAGDYCDSCTHSIRVEAAGQMIGTVRQKRSFWKSYLLIEGPDSQRLFRVKGPCCFEKTSNIFEIFTNQYGTYAGKIYNKSHNSSSKTTLEGVDHYAINFPRSIDPTIKALILAGVFLIDYMFFETKVIDK